MVAGASSLFFSARRVRSADGGFAEGGGSKLERAAIFESGAAGARAGARGGEPAVLRNTKFYAKPKTRTATCTKIQCISQCFTRAVDSDRNAAMLRYIWHPSIKASYT